MKKNILLISLIYLVIICNAQVLLDIDKIAKTEEKSYKNQGIEETTHFSHYGFEIIYHDLYFEIDPAVREIKGSVKSIIKIDYFRDTVIHFDLANELIVDSIKRNEEYLSHRQIGTNVVFINLGKTLETDMLDTFTIYYHGTPPSNGFGSFSQTFHDSIPNIWTLSEPFGARDWWPCKQSLVDKIDSLDIHIKIPKGNLAASNGSLVSIDSTTDSYIFNWKTSYPIATYLVALSVTNYTAIPLTIYFQNDSLTYLNYVYPENYIDGLDGSLLNIQVMKLYDSLFTPYPFMREKYGHAQFGWGGGMEHQTMSFVANFNFELLAHELAHQWFGDKITCGTWQDIWLNEGFATYLTGLAYEHLIDGIYWPVYKRNLINNICRETYGATYIEDTGRTNVSRIFSSRLTYSKGAMILHMLRWKIGDEAFYRGIKHYLTNNRYAYGFAVSEDFIAEMEVASGKNLQEFFNDWLYGQGYPSYIVSWRQKVDNNSVQLKIAQSSSHPSVDFFEMPVAVKFYNKTTDTTIVFNNTTNNEIYNFQLPFKADSAILDPDLWLVQKNSSITNLSNELIKDELVIQVSPQNITNSIDISISSEINEEVEIYLINAVGQKIIDEKLQINFGKTQKSYEVSDIDNGYYFLYLKAGKEVHTFKLLKI